MRTASMLGVALILGVPACASSAADGSSDEEVAEATLLDTTSPGGSIEQGSLATAPVDPAAFVILESFDESVARAYWEPVELDGEPIPPALGPHWRLSGQAERVTLTGFDGCGQFTSSESSTDPTKLVDGTLVELALGGDAIDCGDRVRSAPQQGDTFEISGDGSTIRVTNDGIVRVVLERRSDEPLGDRLTPEEERELEAQVEAEEQEEAARFEQATRGQMEQLRVEVDAARVRWDDADTEDYVVDFSAACLNCASWPTDPTAAGNRYTIVVDDGVGSGPWTESTVGASVERWFDYLDTHLRAGGFAQATFDADLGYPTLLYIALAGPAGEDEPVGVDEAQLSDVRLTPSALLGDDLALIGQLVTSAWVPVEPHAGDVGVEPRMRQWTFSTIGRSFIIAGFDGCNAFGSLIRPEDQPGRLIGGVLADFDVPADEAACPDGVDRLPGPLDGDRLVVTDDGARLEVVRDDQVLIEFVRAA